MLHEIVQLPNRSPDDYVVSTQVMLFSGVNSDFKDQPNIYGCEVDVGFRLYCGEINKYKSIETFGDAIIERLLLTNEPIEFDKKWWTSNQGVIILQSKIHTSRSTYVIKNVNGILACDNLDMIVKQVSTPYIFYNMYYDFLGQLISNTSGDTNTAMKFTNCIPDTDIELVKTIQECDFNWTNFLNRGFNVSECSKYYGGINIVPELSIMPYTDPEVSLKFLANFSNPMAIKLSSYQQYCDNIKTLFEPDSVAFIGGVNYNWYLLELLYKLNSSHYSNITINYDLNKNKMPILQGNTIYNRIANNLDSVITRLFKNWVTDVVKSGITPVDKAVLVKTWSEEVFIELSHMRKIVKRYYFDMIPVIIGTIALH